MRQPLVFLAVCIVFALLFTSPVSAQDIPEDLTDGRMIAIEPADEEPSVVQVGQLLQKVSVNRLGNDPAISTYTLWEVEPASAARIMQSNPIRPAGNSVDIEFLQEGTVTVTVSAFADEDNINPMFLDNIFADTLAFNQVQYTFTVVSADSTQNVQAAFPLNQNQRTAMRALDNACAALSASDQSRLNSGQIQMQATCDVLLLQDNLPTGVDRITAEELFALGDSLTVTADPIGNIQSRLNAVRSSQRSAFDISSLNLQLWDQQIGANVLSESSDALIEFAGGNASSERIRESALGIFANGNVSMGSLDGKDVQRNADIKNNSLTLGADYRIDDQRVFGAALGILNHNTGFEGDNGKMDMQGISLTAFGTWYEQDKGYADIIIELGQHDFDLKRRINLPGQVDEFADSSTSATRMVLSISAGRTFQRGSAEFGPLISMTATRASIDGFQEASSQVNGGSGTALDVKSHALSSVRLSVGGEIKRVVNLSQSVLLPTLRVEWEMESKTDKGTIAATFINDPDDNVMQFIGTQRSRTAMLATAGLTAVFKHGRSAFLSFETRALDDHVSQTRMRLGYRMNF